MILETLGKLVDAEALTSSDTYVGQALDMARVTGYAFSGREIWCVITVNVAADYTTMNETYDFQIRTGTGTDGTDINAGVLTIASTTPIDGDDARVATAGAQILSCSVPYQTDTQRYVQIYYAQAGTTPTITIDANFSPTPPDSARNIQVTDSPVGVL